jgi:hypothetical protein
MRWKQERRARSRRSLRASAVWAGVLVGVAAIVFVPVSGEGLQEKDASSQSVAAIVRAPEAVAQSQANGQGSRDKNPESVNVESKEQIADESAKLLKLATDLKAEVDKTNKDTLSLNVVRKAEEIEKLAHDVKERMKLRVGPG